MDINHWTTKDGRKIPLSELSEKHIENICKGLFCNIPETRAERIDLIKEYINEEYEPFVSSHELF